MSADHDADHDASTAAVNGASSDHLTWSEVVSKRHHRVDTFKQSVVTALYVDQSLKRSRENSLIVNGLVPVSISTDSDLFANLCITEFKTRPDIVSVKRLGQPQVGRVQPLLVHLKRADQAKTLIDAAKLLRRSSDPAVREKVFIGPNLTKAEAAAAYQVRVQRRQAQRRRRESSNHSQTTTIPVLPSADQDAQSGGLPANTDSALPLNPLADSFPPPVAMSRDLND